MDVDADQTGLTADPTVTGVFPRSDPTPGPTGQGQLFTDALYPTYGDTDKLDAVGAGYGVRPSRPARWLRVAVAVVAIAVLAAGTALGLVEAGVIGKSPGPATSSPPPAKHTTVGTTRAPLLTAAGIDAGTAGYRVDVSAYTVTVATTTGRSWVSIGLVGQHPIFEGILAPSSTQREILLGSSQVDVGAGGTKVIVSLQAPVGDADAALGALQLPVHAQDLSHVPRALTRPGATARRG